MKRLLAVALLSTALGSPAAALPPAGDADMPPVVENITAVGGNRKITVSFPTPQGNVPSGLGYDVHTVPAQSGCYIQHSSQVAVSTCVITGVTNGFFYDVIVTAEAGSTQVHSKPVRRVKPTYDPEAKFSISLKPSGPISKQSGSLTMTSTGSIAGEYCARITYMQASAALLAQLRSDWAFNAYYIAGSGGGLPDGTSLPATGSPRGGCASLGKTVLNAGKALPVDMGWKKPTKPGKYFAFAHLYYSNAEFRRFRAPDELVAVSSLVPITVR